MTVAPGFRAVVFALRDLPSCDQRYLTEVAHALRWPPEREPALWDTPLLLVRQSDTPPVPDLRSDDEVAASGPSVLLLGMRLVQADALQWPELRFLGLDLQREAPDYVLYAADPTRWTPESLADSLTAGGTATAHGAATTAVTGASWHIQRGLQTRAARLPPVPGDRVPVLGLQVPMFGGRLGNLRDLRPMAERRRAPIGVVETRRTAAAPTPPTLPAQSVAGHHQGRYALSLLIESITPGLQADPNGEEAQVELTLFRVDTSTRTAAKAALRLVARDLSVLQDAETAELTPAALSDWLAELLPSCFLGRLPRPVRCCWSTGSTARTRAHPRAMARRPPSSRCAKKACGCPGRGTGAERQLPAGTTATRGATSGQRITLRPTRRSST